jgi:hypothetical protein
MKQSNKPHKHIGRTILIILAALLLILAVAFTVYVQDYRHADETALSVLNNPAVRQESNLTILIPDAANDTGDGLIFYPGGKVQAEAYLPLLEQLRENGVTCVLVTMPYHLAVFNIDAADAIYSRFPAVSRWYLGGHSLGGAMASSYIAGNEDKLAGLILLGAYPVNDSKISTLCIYGSEDIMLDRTKLVGVADQLEIAGGNHAQVGNYGIQEGDGVASISREEQQAQAVEAILAFLTKTDSAA